MNPCSVIEAVCLPQFTANKWAPFRSQPPQWVPWVAPLAERPRNEQTDFPRKCLQLRTEAHLLANVYEKLVQPTSVLSLLWCVSRF